MNFFPLSRHHELVIQNLNKETLIYDLQTHKALSLNETASLVWQFCDGHHSVGDIARALSQRLNHPVTEDLILLALNLLSKENLLQNGSQLKNETKAVTRRETIKKISAASVIALPVISSLVAPRAVDAQSTTCTGSCTCSVGNNNSAAASACRTVLGGTSNCPNRTTCDCLVVAGVGSTGGTCVGT